MLVVSVPGSLLVCLSTRCLLMRGSVLLWLLACRALTALLVNVAMQSLSRLFQQACCAGRQGWEVRLLVPQQDTRNLAQPAVSRGGHLLAGID